MELLTLRSSLLCCALSPMGAALAERGVAVRAGMHCAPLAHDSAGTLKTGTIRLSVSDLNTLEECGEFLQIFRECMA